MGRVVVLILVYFIFFSTEHFVHEAEYRLIRDLYPVLADVDTVLHHVEGGRFIGNLRLGIAAEVAATIE